jgi:YHS domain-containing protein
MGASSTRDLAGRLDAVAEEARERVAAFQSQAEENRQIVADRFQKFLPIADRIVAIVREKVQQLQRHLKFEVTPSHIQRDVMYSRSATLDVKTELASVVRLGFRLTHDSDVAHILLDYNLDIVPVFFRFNPHAQLVMPLESYDEAAVAGWIDDRIVDFANAYLELHETKQYQERVMVSDTVAGISFPKHFAAATLEHGGQIYYFVSDETRREFMKRHGLEP